MRLLFAVPLTIVLTALASAASAYVDFNLYYVLIGMTALWAAVDSKTVGVKRYQSQLALDPLPLFVAMVVLWPIVFPWYLYLRYLIKTGQAVLGPQPRGISRRVVIAAGVVAVLWIAGVLGSHYLASDLVLLARQLHEEFRIPVGLELNNGKELVITLQSEAASAAEIRDQLAHRIAVYARTHYARPEDLHSVRIIFATVRQVGIAEITTQDADYHWFAKDLTELSLTAQ